VTEKDRQAAAQVPRLAAALAEAAGDRSFTFMEVCGTHTMAIARYGLRQLLPPGIRLVSGPGCPVCVTAMPDLDTVVAMARLPEVTLCTFGDLVRVPASHTTLAAERAAGADVRVVYSALDAVQIAVDEPHRLVVFAGIGFETTAPTIAAALLTAWEQGVVNFSVLSMHKTMPAPLRALLDAGQTQISGFILPGHVSVITGSDLFNFLVDDYGVGGVVAGFGPQDVLGALLALVGQQRPQISIEYTRAVRPEGNLVAQQIIEQVFEPCDAEWRGLGMIPGSGLRLAPAYAGFDARTRFSVDPDEPREPVGCRCGEVLRGLVDPPECALFGRRCTPEDPIGACMVSSEGSCAAYYRYQELGG
jgi:hydrogenase expression/formation protein HypD